MRSLDAAVRLVTLVMFRASGVLLLLMMVTILVDIVTRTAFGFSGGAVDLTVTGGVEIVRYGLLLMVLFALPHTVVRGQVIVDLFTNGLSQDAKDRLAGLFSLGFAALGTAMAVRFYGDVHHAMATGETTQDLLIPVWILQALACFATAVLAVRATTAGLTQIAGLGETE